MRSGARTAAVTAPALVVVSVAWLRLESPVGPLWRPLALVALALAAAVPQRRSLRLLGAVLATLAAARIAVGVDLVPGFGVARGTSALGTRFGDGFSDFYSTHLPFDPRVHVAMADLVLAGVFAFSLAVALLAAEREPVAAAVVVLLGAGWPATLLGPSHGLAMGAAILGAALLVLAGLGSRRLPALALPAVVVVAAGAVAVGSATAARHGLVHWQTWNLAHVATGPVGVGFVWDAQYGGLEWPAHPSVVLEVQSEQRPAYLRATVLDDFVGDRWSVGLPRPADSLEPAAALQPRNQTRESVTVEGLADNHLVGGSVPIRFSAGTAPLYVPERGFASLGQNLPRGFAYTVSSYSPRPTAAELRRSPPQYPALLSDDDLFDVGRGVSMPPFGAPDRAGTEEALLTVNPDLNSYVQLARLADDVAGSAPTPYDAVARLESWFVSSGGFRYSNRPTVIQPALVGFVTRTRAGYCQYFAGAMALMLRYLGIPSRVAVGFAGGTYSAKGRAWLVTDRDAHAWVEVWFKGYGWLPFDPTPAAPGFSRHPTLAGNYAVPADGAKGGPGSSAQGTRGGRGSGAIADKLSRQNGLVRPHSRVRANVPVVTAGGGGSDRRRAVLFLLLAAAVAVGGIVAAKAGARLLRGRHRDPRRAAAACREELVAFLVDQRIEVPRSATLHELGELVRREFGADPGPFVAAAAAARFGRADPAGARAARRELGLLLTAMRRGLTSRDRLRGLLSLRSLGRPPAAVPRSASLGSGMAESA
ncbi:MAG: transglutaminaseTgpA domain-containing protein [Gaiellaceae bacterium]